MAPNVTSACGVHDFQCIASIAAITTCILSWGGCSVIFASWALMKSVRTPNRRMLLYLTIADFFVATGQLMGASWTLNRHLYSKATNFSCEDPDPVCVVQSFVSTLATMSSFLWSMLIAWHVYRSVLVPGTGTYWLDRHRWAQHLLCWGLPFVIVVVTVCCGRLGLDTVKGKNVPTIASGIWCWIRTCEDDLMKGNGTALEMPAVMTFYMITGQFWVYLAFLVIPTCYIRTKRRISSSVNSSSYNSAALFESPQEADRLMTWVPVTFLLLRMWSCVRFVGNILLVFNEETPSQVYTVLFNQVFLLMQAVGDSAQGFTNCVLYCLLTDSVRIELKKKLGLRIGLGRDTQTEASRSGPGEWARARRERQHRDKGSMHAQLNIQHESDSETEPLLRSSFNASTPT